MYKFKEIQTVPPSEAFIDIVLSRTQRKTPTVVHPGYKISRIRNFYLRKIKYAQTTFAEKFQHILTDFPRIDDIHPFYADLCNVLYDRDHYKLALGQMNKHKNIIDGCAKDYVRMMKFADSLYRCKMLKRAALGRMCTTVKKLAPTLKYLEEVRQHLGRLPSINPTTRTLILTGYPNVGKSSFMNTVTEADVDVQPYAFTTKSLFVGHMDYRYCPWQVIDTPGILDHPLEERNTIEMTAITALAHIPATILFFVDVSETCGFTLKQQAALFESLKPLFRNKPLLVVMNKTDLRKVESLTEDEVAMLKAMTKDLETDKQRVIGMMPISCATKENIDVCREKACDLLLEQRVEQKVNNARVESIKNRIHIAQPTAATASNAKKGTATNRQPIIPESVLQLRQALDNGKTREDILGEIETEKDLQEEDGGAGVFQPNVRGKYMLAEDDWKYDSVPEFMDGHNVADFVDSDILAKLDALEREEELELAAEGGLDTEKVLAEWKETESKLFEVHGAIRQKRCENRLRKSSTKMGQGGTERHRVKDIAEITEGLKALGKTPDEKSLRGRSKNRKRQRDESTASTKGDEGVSGSQVRSKSKVRGFSIIRSKSRVSSAMPSAEDQERAEVKRRKVSRRLSTHAKKGEGDRWVPDMKPKHLHSGKRGMGKTDRR